MKQLYTLDGRFVAYMIDEMIYARGGRYLGYLIDDDAYSVSGHYLGQIMEGGYLLRPVGLEYPKLAAVPTLPSLPALPSLPQIGAITAPGYHDSLADLP